VSAGRDFGIISPVRDEAENLPRLAGCLASQTLLPSVWVIVDNGSTDGTQSIANEIAAQHNWVRLLEIPGEAIPRRGAPIVRAFKAGLGSLPELPEVVVKLDADISMEPDYFERLMLAFAQNDELGIASGVCWEQSESGDWAPQYATRDHVRGAVRAYRRECLLDVLPLVERMGWDGIDELKAQTRGWVVGSIPELVLLHHRSLGQREHRVSKWIDQGEMAHFMGYRPSYLVIRAVYRAVGDIAAFAMVWGYARAAASRAARYDDAAVLRHVRELQSWRQLPRRIRESFGGS
jgi:glycosyltransferase involved in cell wall biosynthesis